MPGDGDALDFLEKLQQSFNGIIRGPNGEYAGMIDFQLSMGDGAIVGAKVGDHCCHGDIGKAKGVIIKLG